MQKKSYTFKIILVLVIFVGLFLLLKKGGSFFSSSNDEEASIKVEKNSILHMELSGVIMNGKKFIKNLKKYKKDSHVKAIVINVNSPGGAVGPSQEVYAEIKRAREETKKPIICVTTGIMASGAYYSAVACDKIVVAPGALVGSIGVIMEFANLSKLYDWAKVSRFTITSGKYKDSGNEFREMREDEKSLFQDMIKEVYQQFRSTVKESRKLKDEVLDQYADGRVFTGTTAVKMGFADQEGTFEDAVQLAAKEANLGSDFEVIELPKKKRSIFDFGEANEDDPVNSLGKNLAGLASLQGEALKSAMNVILKTEYINQPMLIMPGFWKADEN
ncbi:MAG: signal peptide peptidase SppA [Bdellovibrionaceae bacterium]|nr:signal peptide peptidase SppA [Pseudobdellovibrionaceae bacterium]